MKTLGIGEAARLCGVSPDTLRHYERRALIAPPERTASGYRRYSPDTITRVHQIRRALALGFRLRELAEVFGIRRRGGLPCRKTLGILEQRLEEVEAKLAELERLRNTMRTTVAEWRERVEAVGPDTAARLLEGR